jgi:hypothetical protein
MESRGGVSGLLIATIITPDPDACIIEGLKVRRGWTKDSKGFWTFIGYRHNAFLNQGLQAVARRYANIATVPAAPTGIAVSSDNTAVTATSTTFGGTFRYAAVNATFPSISAQTVSYQSDFTKGSGAGQIDFSVRKLGVTNATTDAVGAVQDIIGGAGSSPYNEPLTIDLTSTTSFTFRPQIDMTFLAV